MKTLASPLCLIMLAGVALPAGAVDEIERSCTAYYAVHVSSVNNADGQWLYSIAEVIGTGTENSFTARRGCGRLVPNRCRQRASDAALQCMKAHVRTPAQVPAECRSNGVQDYPVANPEELAQTAACRYLHSGAKVNPGMLPRNYTVSVVLRGKVYGDEGCGGGDRRNTSADLATLTVSCTR